MAGNGHDTPPLKSVFLESVQPTIRAAGSRATSANVLKTPKLFASYKRGSFHDSSRRNGTHARARFARRPVLQRGCARLRLLQDARRADIPAEASRSRALLRLSFGEQQRVQARAAAERP